MMTLQIELHRQLALFEMHRQLEPFEMHRQLEPFEMHRQLELFEMHRLLVQTEMHKDLLQTVLHRMLLLTGLRKALPPPGLHKGLQLTVSHKGLQLSVQNTQMEQLLLAVVLRRVLKKHFGWNKSLVAVGQRKGLLFYFVLHMAHCFVCYLHRQPFFFMQHTDPLQVVVLNIRNHEVGFVHEIHLLNKDLC